MMQGTRSPARRREDAGFTLIELLVVITILGVLAAVVVFSVRGVTDKGQSTAATVDAQTVRTAEEAYRAQHATFADEPTLVAAGLLAAPSTLTDVALLNGGKSFMLGYHSPNGGSPSSIASLTLAAGTGNGYPTPFAWVRGPGYANANYVFDPLYWRDATGNAVPWLASDQPTVSADGLTWTIPLRSGVKWSDGQPFTASDVAFTFTYQTTGPASGAANGGFYKSYFPYITSVTADTPTQVTFHLNTAFNTFMVNIGEELVVIPQHIWTNVTSPFTYGTPTQTAGDTSAAGPVANAYVGTGPYTFVNPSGYNPSTGVGQYAANPTFFLGIPYIRQLKFVTVSNNVAALLAGPSGGGVDAGAPGNEEAVTPAATSSLSGLPNIGVPGGWNRSIQFNFFAGFPYNDVRFRQAMAYAIDRQDLLTTILGGRGQVPSMGTLSPSHAFLAPNLPTYSVSVASANSLLDALGMTTSCGTPGPSCFRNLPASLGGGPFTAHLRSTSRFLAQTVTLVQQYMASVGINSVVDAVDANDNQATAGNYSMMVEGWGNITSDPDQLRTRMSDMWTGQLTPACTPTPPLHSGCYANGSFTAVYGWNATNNTGGTDHSADFVAKAQDQLFTTSASQRLADVQAMQVDVALDVPEIQLYVPTALIYYQKGGFSAWYSTPGGTPPGPPGFNNKEVFVTGKQFGLPAGF